MSGNRKWRNICIILVLVLLIGSITGILLAERTEPADPLEARAEELNPENLQGDMGDNDADIDADEESETESESQSESEETQTDTETETETESESETETESSETRETETTTETESGAKERTQPSTDPESGSEPGTGDETGDEPGPGGDDETETGNGETEEPETRTGLITDLRDGMLLITTDLTDDTLNFYAYFEDGRDVTVRYRHKDDKGNGRKLTSQDGKHYSVKLKLGMNYFDISYRDDRGNIVHTLASTDPSIRGYTIRYQAEKADEDKPEIGEHPPVITTNLDDKGDVFVTNGSQYNFIVSARTWEGGIIYSNNITVTVNGKALKKPTGVGTYEYELNFTNPDDGDVNHYVITVLAWDNNGNSRFEKFYIDYHALSDGEEIGTVTILIDATTLQLDILDSGTVKLIQGDTAADVVERFLDEYGYTYDHGGTIAAGSYYLRRIYRGDIAKKAAIHPVLLAAIERDNVGFTQTGDRDSLGEQDYTRGSGWMYSVNGHYAGKGLSQWKPNNGDVIALRFTLSYGKDVGGSGQGTGALRSYCGIWADGVYTATHVFDPENGGGDYDQDMTKRIEPTETEDGQEVWVCRKCEDMRTIVLPRTGSETESQTESESETESQTESESETESQTESESETESQTESESETESRTESESETESRTESESETESESQSDPETDDDGNIITGMAMRFIFDYGIRLSERMYVVAWF